MIARAFVDELTRGDLGLQPLQKVARVSSPTTQRMIERLIAGGALGATALHGGEKLKAALTGEYGPEGSFGRSALRGATGGALAGGLLAALGKLSKR